MDKKKLQDKFRLVLIISAGLMFITLLLPAYIKYGKAYAPSKAIMMWTVIFGAAKNNVVNSAFDFSWIGFIPYFLIIIMLIIALFRKFISVDGSDKQVATLNQTLDVINVVISFISLFMFIALPFTVTSKNISNALITNYYGFGFAMIFTYVIGLVMVVSSICVLITDTLIKFKKLKNKGNESNNE